MHKWFSVARRAYWRLKAQSLRLIFPETLNPAWSGRGCGFGFGASRAGCAVDGDAAAGGGGGAGACALMTMDNTCRSAVRLTGPGQGPIVPNGPNRPSGPAKGPPSNRHACTFAHLFHLAHHRLLAHTHTNTDTWHEHASSASAAMIALAAAKKILEGHLVGSGLAQ